MSNNFNQTLIIAPHTDDGKFRYSVALLTGVFVERIFNPVAFLEKGLNKFEYE